METQLAIVEKQGFYLLLAIHTAEALDGQVEMIFEVVLVNRLEWSHAHTS